MSYHNGPRLLPQAITWFCNQILTMCSHYPNFIDYFNTIKPSVATEILHSYSRHGRNTRVVKQLIAFGADVNFEDSYRMNTLHHAVQNRTIEIVTMLLEQHASVNCQANMTGYTQLHRATRNGHLEMVELLLNNGADANNKSFFGYTPLEFAIQLEDKGICNLLLTRGANPNTIMRIGEPLLLYALENKDKATAELLLE